MRPATVPDPALPPFAEAVETLIGFLACKGAPTELFWLERDDVTSCGQRIWVRPGDRAGAARRAEMHYATAQTKGLGAALVAYCRVGDAVGCYVWWPENEIDASVAIPDDAEVQDRDSASADDSGAIRDPLAGATGDQPATRGR